MEASVPSSRIRWISSSYGVLADTRSDRSGGGLRQRRPIPWLQHRQQLGLERAGRVLRRVLPRGERRQAHEHALDPGVGLKTEQRAPIVHQVELDIAAPPGKLEAALPLTIPLSPPSLDDRAVSSR